MSTKQLIDASLVGIGLPSGVVQKLTGYYACLRSCQFWGDGPVRIGSHFLLSDIRAGSLILVWNFTQEMVDLYNGLNELRTAIIEARDRANARGLKIKIVLICDQGTLLPGKRLRQDCAEVSDLTLAPVTANRIKARVNRAIRLLTGKEPDLDLDYPSQFRQW